MITVVLVESENVGNVGAIARAMKNFGLERLVLINPKCNHLDEIAVVRAKHAKDVLKKAKLADFSVLKRFDYVIGTTAMLGTDYNIPRSPITPDELANSIDRRNKIALVFGRDGSGLTNEEIGKCDFIVTIPSSEKYATLNISHAASAIFYELFKKSKKRKIDEHIISASGKDKEIVMKRITQILDKLSFTTPEKKETQQKVWKRIIGKSFLTKREAFAVLGFLRKIKNKLG